MRNRIASCLVVIIVLVAIPAMAGESEPIEGWKSFREDTKMMQGALDNTVTFGALRTYIPGFGVVFIMQARGDTTVEAARKEFEKVLKHIVPTVEILSDDEHIVLAISGETYPNEWELTYITTKALAADPEAWTVYYNEVPRY